MFKIGQNLDFFQFYYFRPGKNKLLIFSDYTTPERTKVFSTFKERLKNDQLCFFLFGPVRETFLST
jgi:hypothetical protein